MSDIDGILALMGRQDRDDLIAAGRDPDDESEGRGWLIGPAECRVCDWRGYSVAPVGAPLQHLECSHCGHMTVEMTPE